MVYRKLAGGVAIDKRTGEGLPVSLPILAVGCKRCQGVAGFESHKLRRQQ